MTFTSPFTAVPGEIITAAGWNTSARDNINHMWGVMGGDPGTSNLVPISTGASSSTWMKVPDIALFDQKVSQTSTLLVDANALLPAGLYYMINTSINGPVAGGHFHVLMQRYVDPNYRVQYASDLIANGRMYMRTIINGVIGSWRKIWTQDVQGVGSGLDADSVRGSVPGNSAGNLALNNGVLCTGLNAQMISGLVVGNTSGTVPISNGVMNVNLNAQLHAGLIAGNGSGNIPISNGVTNAGLVAANSAALSGSVLGNASGNVAYNNGVMNVALNAALLAGLIAGNGSGNIPISNGSQNTSLVASDSAALASVGGANYARKDIASDFAVRPTFASRDLATMNTGQFAGAGSGVARQVTSGMLCKCVILIGIGSGFVIHFTTSQTSGQAIRIEGNGATIQINQDSPFRLHGSNGFLVGATDNSDNSAYTYFWAAWG